MFLCRNRGRFRDRVWSWPGRQCGLGGYEVTDKPKDGNGRIAALLMLAGGVDPRDVARLLKVRPEQVKAWMSQDGKPESECD